MPLSDERLEISRIDFICKEAGGVYIKAPPVFRLTINCREAGRKKMNYYVPWDVNFLNKFIDHMKLVIGSVVNKGSIVFAMIIGILLIMAIIRRASH